MAIEKKREFNQKIADLKSKSMQEVANKFSRTLALGEFRTLPDAPAIVRPQRVTS
jgi:hypothetical protein